MTTGNTDDRLLHGFGVQIDGVMYTISTHTSSNTFTLTSNYAGTTGTYNAVPITNPPIVIQGKEYTTVSIDTVAKTAVIHPAFTGDTKAYNVELLGWRKGNSGFSCRLPFHHIEDPNPIIRNVDFTSVGSQSTFYQNITFPPELVAPDLSNWKFGITPRQIAYSGNSGNNNQGLGYSLSGAFQNCTNFNTNTLSTWDVRAVGYFSNCFASTSAFNGDIRSWDTSGAISMYRMFYSATNFNQNISSWDTSRVTNMEGMFRRANAFNQPIGDWDVSNVINMHEMFYSDAAGPAGASSANKFNSYIGDWDTGRVTDMSYMFAGNIYGDNQNNRFNQDISSWDTSSVTDMTQMFYGNAYFNQPIGSWDTSSVTDMTSMFASRSGRNAQFNQDLSSWNVSNVTSFGSMFVNCNNISAENIGALSSWNVTSACLNLGGIFTATGRGHLWDGTGWDVSNVTSLSSFASYNAGFSIGFDNWSTGNVTSMDSFMRFGTDYKKTTESISISSYTGNQITLASAASSDFVVGEYAYLQRAGIGSDLSTIITAISVDRLTLTVEVAAEDWPSGYRSTITLCSPGYGSNPNVEAWDVSSVTSFASAFENCSIYRDLSAWDLTSATTMTNFAERMPDSKVAAALVGWGNNVNTNTGVNAGGVFGSRDIDQTTYASAKSAYDTLVDSVANGGKGWILTGLNWV
jgi:surface protein